MENLKSLILEISDNKISDINTIMHVQNELLNNLNNGSLRSASPNGDGTWTVNEWVKKGILILFKYSSIVDMSLSLIHI